MYLSFRWPFFLRFWPWFHPYWKLIARFPPCEPNRIEIAPIGEPFPVITVDHEFRSLRFYHVVYFALQYARVEPYVLRGDGYVHPPVRRDLWLWFITHEIVYHARIKLSIVRYARVHEIKRNYVLDNSRMAWYDRHIKHLKAVTSMANNIEQQEFTSVNMDGVPHLGPIRYIRVPQSPSYKWQGLVNEANCLVCGRDVKIAKAHAFHAINGGGSFLHPDDEPNYVSDGGDMCTQYVGPDCLRRFPQIKEYEHKANAGINEASELAAV
jgi:hypothetical protein